MMLNAREYSPKKMTGGARRAFKGAKIGELVPLRVLKPKMTPVGVAQHL